MPRQPYSVAVKSDWRSGYIPCPFGKGKGLGVSKGPPLRKRGTGESKKQRISHNSLVITK